VGAEKLLGRGDMLFSPSGARTPTRVQGCFVSDEEVNRITSFIRSNSHEEYDPTVIEQLEQENTDQSSLGGDTLSSSDGSDLDPLLKEAIEMAVGDGQTSISMLQRRLRIGYARAGRLIDEMTRRGIISQAAGAKPREVLLSREELDSLDLS
ncbi:MAG: DNA translocase FtsK, partial [Clostridiales bacterium]|nr:DNA translocase FtsK [Clostridiales bacterium]